MARRPAHRWLSGAAIALGALLSTAPSHAAPPSAAQPARVTGSCADGQDVSVGGVTGFASLADPTATERLRGSCRVGLYIHAEAWRPLDDATRARILANFKDSGPPVVELGYAATAPSFFRRYYKPTFIDQGVRADTALVNGLCHDGAAGALTYIRAARQYGLQKVAVVFAPNSGQFRTSRFSDPQWECVRAAALAGGAIAVDAPPHVYFALGTGYQQFVADELRWADENRVEGMLIISPSGSGPRFADEAGRMLAALATSGARPAHVVFETYDIQRRDVANQVGRESDPATVAGVALRLLPKIAR